MKRNVDLTEDSVFHQNSLIFNFNILLNKKHPWSMEDDVFKEISSDEFFFTGTKEERKRKKENHSYRTFLGCDRCGATLKPWDFFKELCSECSEDLDNSKILSDLFKIPW